MVTGQYVDPRGAQVTKLPKAERPEVVPPTTQQVEVISAAHRG